MGVLTDFVVANLKDAARINDYDVRFGEHAAMAAKNVDHVHLGVLDSTLKRAAFDLDFMVVPNPLVWSESDEGPWVFQLPAQFVARLAAVDDADITNLVAQWAKSDEWYFRPSPAELVVPLRSMIALARKAVAEDKALLMWMSL